MPEFSFPTDTSPEALRVQFELVRKMSPRERLARLDALTAFARNLTLLGIRRAHPGASEDQVLELFYRLRLGPQLAERVLEARRRRRAEVEGTSPPGSPS